MNDKIREAYIDWSISKYGTSKTVVFCGDAYEAGYQACASELRAELEAERTRLDFLANSGRTIIFCRDGCYTFNHTSGRYGPTASDPRSAIDQAIKEKS